MIYIKILELGLKKIKYLLLKFNFLVVNFNTPKRKASLKLIKKIQKDKTTSMGYNALYQVLMATRISQKIPGEIAEVGVFKGGSAKVICELKQKKELHLFDTFEGIPEVDEIDKKFFHKNQFATSFNAVKDYLKKYSGVTFHKGVFPATTKGLKPMKYSLVHLDADTYKTTLDALKYFYPKMSKGGIIISHDYTFFDGVAKSFHEFFDKKREVIIETASSHCMVIKL